MDVDQVLEHHGIKGQRWGIRNKVNPSTGRVSSDHRVVSDLRKRPKPTLTNKQLQTVNTRLGLEQNFNRLNPSSVQRGHNHIKSIITTAGTVTAIIGIVNGPIGKTAVKFIAKHKNTIAKPRTFS